MDEQQEGYCESCGRYIGAYKICPYCGAKVKERLSVKALKIFSLAFTFIGVIAVYFVARSADIKKIAISDIKEEMNYAVVCVEGVVSRAPTFSKDAQTLTFYIEDTTGSMRVSAYRKDVEALKSANKIPRMGDRVTVCGTVRVVEGTPSLIVNMPERVSIVQAPQAGFYDIEAISDSLLNKIVKVSGKVLSVKQTTGPLSVLIGSLKSSSKISMAIFKNQFTPPELNPGDTIEVVGVVTKYKEQFQIQPRDSNSIVVIGKAEVVEPASAPITQIGSINKSMVGAKVKISGKIESVKKIKNGMLINVSDGTGVIAVLVWDKTLAGVPGKELIVGGNSITAFGAVEFYKNKLELKVESGEDIQVSGEKKATTTPAEKKAEAVSIGSIDKSRIDKIVSVSGKIVKVKDIKNGKLFEVADETGSIPVVIWSKALKYVKSPELLAEGAIVSLKGKVSEYKGKLEIIVNRGEDIKLTGPGKSTKPSGTAGGVKRISEINSSMENQRVTVSGVVQSVKSISKGRVVELKDDTGTITVILWDNVWSEVSEKVTEGATLTITGKVKIYKDKLEVIPSKGADIKVTE